MMFKPELLARWFRDNADAAQFIQIAWDAAQSWDDLVDEGHSDGAEAMVAWMAFGKEYDPFFAAHAHILRPVMLGVYLQWQAATRLEAEPTKARIEKSFMLRAGFYGLMHVTAFLCGGHDHARALAAEIYDTYGERLADLEREFL